MAREEGRKGRSVQWKGPEQNMDPFRLFGLPDRCRRRRTLTEVCIYLPKVKSVEQSQHWDYTCCVQPSSGPGARKRVCRGIYMYIGGVRLVHFEASAVQKPCDTSAVDATGASPRSTSVARVSLSLFVRVPLSRRRFYCSWSSKYFVSNSCHGVSGRLVRVRTTRYMKEGRAPTTVESHASLEQKRRDFTVVVQEGTRSGAGSERPPGPSQAVFRLVKVFFFRNWSW